MKLRWFSRRVPVAVAAVLLALLAAPASAVLISGTDVGAVDTIIGAADSLIVPGVCTAPGSNPTNEGCWGSYVAGQTFTVGATQQNVGVIYNDTNTLAAFALVGDPSFFIVKNAQAWVLLQNNSKTGFGVLDLTNGLLSGLKLNLGKSDQLSISHVTGVGGTASVPEPGTLAVLAAGLVALGLMRRRRAL